MSDLFARLGRYAEAAEALGRAMDLHEEDNNNDKVALSHLLAKSEQLPQALKVIASVLAVDSENIDLLRFKASILERHGSYKDAFKAIQKVSELDPQADFLAADYQRIRNRYLKSFLTFWRLKNHVTNIC